MSTSKYEGICIMYMYVYFMLSPSIQFMESHTYARAHTGQLDSQFISIDENETNELNMPVPEFPHFTRYLKLYTKCIASRWRV